MVPGVRIGEPARRPDVEDDDIWHTIRNAIRKIDMDDDLTLLTGRPGTAPRWRSARLAWAAVRSSIPPAGRYLALEPLADRPVRARRGDLTREHAGGDGRPQGIPAGAGRGDRQAGAAGDPGRRPTCTPSPGAATGRGWSPPAARGRRAGFPGGPRIVAAVDATVVVCPSAGRGRAHLSRVPPMAWRRTLGRSCRSSL
jgi:hypothetical protein